MTANQIAAAGQKEEVRHNQVAESETKRHNEATEEYNRQSLDYQRQYDQQRMALEEKLTKLQLEFQTANEARKRDIEAEEMGIRQQLANVEQTYKSEMTIIEASRANADKMYKEAMTKLGQFNADIEAKRAYYENQKTEAQTWSTYFSGYLGLKKLETEKAEIQQRYELGLISAEQRNKELEMKNKELEFEQQKWDEALKAESKTRSFSNVANPVVNAASKLFNYMR